MATRRGQEGPIGRGGCGREEGKEAAGSAGRAATASLVASQQAGRAPGLVRSSEAQKACASRRDTRSVKGEESGLRTGTLPSGVRLRRAARNHAFIVSARRARSWLIASPR